MPYYHGDGRLFQGELAVDAYVNISAHDTDDEWSWCGNFVTVGTPDTLEAAHANLSVLGEPPLPTVITAVDILDPESNACDGTFEGCKAPPRVLSYQTSRRWWRFI